MYCGGRRNVTHGKADNGEILAIGEIAAITTFSSGEDEQVEVVSDDRGENNRRTKTSMPSKFNLDGIEELVLVTKFVV